MRRYAVHHRFSFETYERYYVKGQGANRKHTKKNRVRNNYDTQQGQRYSYNSTHRREQLVSHLLKDPSDRFAHQQNKLRTNRHTIPKHYHSYHRFLTRLVALFQQHESCYHNFHHTKQHQIYCYFHYTDSSCFSCHHERHIPILPQLASGTFCLSYYSTWK